MRVAILAESYLPYLSGVTVSADALARGLGARGHDVLVIAPRPSAGALPGGAGSPGPEPRYAWLPSYQLPVIAPPGYRMPWPAPMASALRQAITFAPDVVHAQSPFVTGLLARRLARRVGVPMIFTHHTRFAQYRHYLGPLGGPGGALTDAYLRRFWAGCAAIVAPSSDLAAEIEARLPPGRRPIVRVVPTGIDVAGIRALPRVDVRAAAEWPLEAIVVVTLGRLAREKSVDVVLDAVALAASSVTELRLLVVGGGPAEEELRARASAADLAGRVSFTGALPRPAALAYVKGGDLFAFASSTETQGLVLAEALACGLPVVALDVPGVRDTVRDEVDGLVIPDAAEGERAALAAGLVRLVGDGAALRALAEAARRDAERFDLAVRIGEVEAVYGEVLARPRG